MAGSMQYKNSAKIRLLILFIGTLNGKGLEICEELWTRNVDSCRLEEVRWKGFALRLISMPGRKYKLRWSGNQEGYGGVGVLLE